MSPGFRSKNLPDCAHHQPQLRPIGPSSRVGDDVGPDFACPPAERLHDFEQLLAMPGET
jgi:hypothetical protein